MKTMTIRNVPEELLAELKARARLNRRSLNQQVIFELNAGAQSKEEDVESELFRIEELRKEWPTMTADEIHAAKNEGRK